MKEEVGYPFDQLPTEMFWTARGGGAGWSSICGTLPPAMAAIGLVVDTDTAMQLVDELFAWFIAHPFPEYQPHGEDYAKVAGDSTLCHVQVSKWLAETGYRQDGPERSDRCGGASADVAKFTVEMLNAYADNAFEAAHSPAAVVGECMACHGGEGFADTRGKETCTECHGNLPDPHPDGY
ncbi:MAG: C_GCAxxG_C_C family protein [Tindallia sp. MSAO_Bac2]|nr:MAG: C_GCAxxG_C_C family protein [Tindallia sp. MSAO_Bac2]